MTMCDVLLQCRFMQIREQLIVTAAGYLWSQAMICVYTNSTMVTPVCVHCFHVCFRRNKNKIFAVHRTKYVSICVESRQNNLESKLLFQYITVTKMRGLNTSTLLFPIDWHCTTNVSFSRSYFISRSKTTSFRFLRSHKRTREHKLNQLCEPRAKDRNTPLAHTINSSFNWNNKCRTNNWCWFIKL